MSYNFSQAHIVEQKFQKYFGVSFRRFFHSWMSALCGHICIDLDEFDKWLNEKWGDYNKNNDTSIRDCVVEHYGEDAEKFIKELF